MIARRLISIIFLWFYSVNPVNAGGTRIWEMAGFEELEKGVLDGTTLSSRGEISVGLGSTKIDMDEVGVVYSSVRSPQGDIFLGTGYDGKIYRKRGDTITLISETKQLVVTALVLDAKGNLYVAALPDPIIWRIEGASKSTKPVSAKKWATLPEESEHIFSLVFSRDNRTLFAGTGPEGIIFAIGLDKKPQIYLKSDEEHILSLALDSEGRLLAGTSPSSKLLRVTGPGRASALADFDATEVKAIAVGKDDIFVAVNEFKSPPKVPDKKAISSSTSKTSVLGDGALYAIDNIGRQSLLWKEKKAHVNALALAKTSTLFAGLGSDGKVISIDREKQIRNELDLDERQIMTLLASDSLLFAGCGDAGAAYDVFKAKYQEAVYLSPILETEIVSTFGRVEWLADGKMSVQSRSGNTIAPDKLWSAWSKQIKSGELIPSPAARYLQLRFSFDKAKDGTLISAQVAFKPQNLKATITEMDPGSPFPKPSGSDDNLSDRTIASRPDVESDPELSLKWKVKNPDDDDLRYRLWYRKVGTKLWRPILREDQVLETPRYTWNTTSVPEGTYQLKLTAEDSIQNDPRDVLLDTFVSVPIVVDNNPPEIRNLSIKKGRIAGSAEDSYSKIGAVEMAIDNGPWIPISPKDGLYDESQESFDLPLPKTGVPGPHAAAVRAYDRRGNMGIFEVHFEER